MATGSFQASEFHRPLSGNEFEEMVVASLPTAVIHHCNGSAAVCGVEQSPSTTTHGLDLGQSGLSAHSRVGQQWGEKQLFVPTDFQAACTEFTRYGHR